MATTNFEFTASSAETVKLWSELLIRDAEHQLFWGPFMYSATNDDQAVRHPDAGKGSGIIRVHTEFQEKAGDRVTIHNVASINGEPVYGDALLRDTGADVDTYTMDLYFDQIAKQVRDKGKLAAQRSLLDFNKVTKPQLAAWFRRQVEGSIVRALWGLTSANNTAVLTRLNQPTTTTTTVLNNTIQAFASDQITYAGDATSDGTIDSADVMTAQLLTKVNTAITEDRTIPMEGLDIGGEMLFPTFMPRRGIEQLVYDPDWRESQGTWVKDQKHPLIRQAVGRVGDLLIIPYANCLNPTANVARAVVCGKDALQFAKVQEPEWWNGHEDSMDRRRIIAIAAMYGVAPTYFNSSRRNAHAIDFYVRT